MKYVPLAVLYWWYRSLPSRERGLKCLQRLVNSLSVQVAPFAGAWIEIQGALKSSKLLMRSLPSRERGLKFTGFAIRTCGILSLPSRERGLKYFYRGIVREERRSLPSRERGLKCSMRTKREKSVHCRSLRGSVEGVKFSVSMGKNLL